MDTSFWGSKLRKTKQMSRLDSKLIGTHLPRLTLYWRPVGWFVGGLIACFLVSWFTGPLSAEGATPNTAASGVTPASTAPAVTTTKPSETAALLAVLQTKNNEPAKLAVCQAIAEVKVQDPALIPPLLGLLKEESGGLREAAATALGVYDDPDVVEKLRAYRAHQHDQQLIKSYIFHLKLLYERTRETDRPALLISWLKSSLVEERTIALTVVYEAMGKGTQPANGILQQIRNMLNDPDDQVRIQLIEILRDLRNEKDAPLVRGMLSRQQSSGVREAIYKALGLLEDPASIEICIKGLNDPEPDVAAGAATALCLLLNPKPDPKLLDSAVEALLAKTKSPITHQALRESVIGAMAKIAHPKFVATLRAHAGANEKIPSIRQAAIRGMGAIGDHGQIDIVLARLTDDTDPSVREASAEAVGKLGSSSDHLRPLRSRLDSKVESSAAVRNAAWDAYRLIFNRLEIDKQQSLIESWTGIAATSVNRRIELLGDMEKKISTSGGDPTKQAWVTQRLIEDYLQSTTPEKAIDLAAKVKSAPEREAAAALLFGYVQQSRKTDARGAGEFVAKLKKSVPDLFGAKWAPQFAQTQPAATQAVTTQPSSSQPAK
jgi:HEAT repeat protein